MAKTANTSLAKYRRNSLTFDISYALFEMMERHASSIRAVSARVISAEKTVFFLVLNHSYCPKIEKHI